MTTIPQPLYDIDKVNPAYHLRYLWTGWPAGGSFATCPTPLLDTLEDDFQKDGVRLIEHRWTAELIQLTLSTSPTVSPALLAQHVKGRLDHAIRAANLTLPFSRKLDVRSLGENRRVDVEKYIREQVSRERFVDTGCEQRLKSYTVVNSNVDLIAPTASARGRYWYNLHVVLLAADQQRITTVAQLCLLRDAVDAVAAMNGHAISSLALMPDYLHVELRGNIAHSPAEIGRCFQNNLAHAVGSHRVWADEFYVGSFGEYDMDSRSETSATSAFHPACPEESRD